MSSAILSGMIGNDDRLQRVDDGRLASSAVFSFSRHEDVRERFVATRHCHRSSKSSASSRQSRQSESSRVQGKKRSRNLPDPRFGGRIAQARPHRWNWEAVKWKRGGRGSARAVGCEKNTAEVGGF